MRGEKTRRLQLKRKEKLGTICESLDPLIEDRGGMQVEVNVKTGRGIGVRKSSKRCWEARRPNPMRKGGWGKRSSHVGCDARRNLILREQSTASAAHPI